MRRRREREKKQEAEEKKIQQQAHMGRTPCRQADRQQNNASTSQGMLKTSIRKLSERDGIEHSP